jgi:hypothetical protein
MYPSEIERRERRTLDAPLSALHDDQVLLFPEWCRLNRISERTGRRIIARPDGPVVTQLSPKRIGITVRNNRTWQKPKERA